MYNLAYVRKAALGSYNLTRERERRECLAIIETCGPITREKGRLPKEPMFLKGHGVPPLYTVGLAWGWVGSEGCGGNVYQLGGCVGW